MSTPPIIAGGPTAGSALSFEDMPIDGIISAVMQARYDTLRDLVQKQADTIQARNEQLCALNNERVELVSKGITTPEDKERMDALDEQIASVMNMQQVEMIKLQTTMSKMNQTQEQLNRSQDQPNTTAGKLNDLGIDFGTNIR